MHVIVGLEDADLIIREFDGEAFDQGEFVLDLAAFGLGLVFSFGEFVWGGVLFECDLELLDSVKGMTVRPRY